MKGRSAKDVLERARDRQHGPNVRELVALNEQLTAEVERLRARKARPKVAVKKGKPAKHTVRVIVPDSHGAHIDQVARDVFLADLEQLAPDEVVMLGDHLDCGGTFSVHQRTYTNELAESYASDVEHANSFLDEIQARAPNAQIHYLEGNHEQHVERWAARSFQSFRDAEMVLGLVGPEGVLRLRQRGIRYVRRSQFVDGLSIPGTIRLGRCFFTHGVSHSRHADAVHLERFGASVVFGHIHRATSVVSRTVTSDGHGAWCPGTLARLQPLYKHTQPSMWSHGYAIQLIKSDTGVFLHLNVPILGNVSMLGEVAALGGRHARS